MSKDSLLLHVVIFAVIIVIMLINSIKSKSPSAGLPLVFVVNLTMNHFFGALVHTFHWYSNENYEYTYLGFQETLYGMAAFAVGSIMMSPFFIAKSSRKSDNEMIRPHPKLVTRYLQIGLITYFFLGPVLGRIPTIGTFVQSAWNLLIVAVCLLCRRAWMEGKPSKILIYLALSALFPFFTSFSSGFLNYGVRAVISILFFAATFFKPRRLVILMVFVSVYLGLSLYVTYFRDRDELRQAIWYGQETTTQRIGRVLKTLTQFEFMDFRNDDHVKRIDIRLNQNDFVGRSVEYLEEGRVPFARGSTFSDAVISLVPRFIWANKPTFAGSGTLVSRYTGLYLSETTSFGVGYVMEFYINFGRYAVIIGFLVLGIVIRLFDSRAARHLIRGDWQGFTLWFLPACGLTETVDTLPALVAASAASLIFCFLIHRFLLRTFIGFRLFTGKRGA